MSVKIAYVINHKSFFASHILPIAKIAVKKGYKVKLFCGIGGSDEMEKDANLILKKNSIGFEKFNFSPSGLNIIKELHSFYQLKNSIKKFNPQIIHAATPKGITYGGLVALLLNIRGIVFFITGMGFLFSNELNLKEKFFKFFYLKLKKILFLKKNKRIVIENKDDIKFYKSKYKIKNQIVNIKGSGVNLRLFKPYVLKKKNQVLLPSRVLKEKGIIEFIKAADQLKKKYPKWTFKVCGTINYLKRSSFSQTELKKLNKNKSVIFKGFSKNILKELKQSSIVCLPSYREGLPKSLSEAAACGVPIVTTNVTGCRDAIINNKTGVLCKVKDYNSLAKKIELLILNKKLRKKFSKNARKFALKHFDINNVIKKNLKLYKELTKDKV